MLSVYVCPHNRTFFSEPYILTPEQKQNPLLVIYSFFDCQHLEQARENLSELLRAVLTGDLSSFTTPRDREDAIYFCQKIEELMEGAFLVLKNAKTA
jgi:hypothetical protein